MSLLHEMRVTFEAKGPIDIEMYCGSALRGALLSALQKRLCIEERREACQPCEKDCPVNLFIKPEAEKEHLWETLPPPFFITQYTFHQGMYQIGDRCTFGITLIGKAKAYYHQILRAILSLEEVTLGRPVKAQWGARGKIRILEIVEVHPFSGASRILWKPETPQPLPLGYTISLDDVRKRAEQLPTDEMALSFLSPTRIIRNKHPLIHVDFEAIITRLASRFEHVMKEYTNETGYETGTQWYLYLKEHAKQVKVERDNTHWVDVYSHSKDQESLGMRNMGGLLGELFVKGPLEDLRYLLVWGEMLRIGKNIVKGAGRYTIIR